MARKEDVFIGGEDERTDLNDRIPKSYRPPVLVKRAVLQAIAAEDGATSGGVIEDDGN